MKTECQARLFELQPLGRRDVVAEFTGGTITSDAGAVLLREVEARTGLLERFASCFDDHRNPDKVAHPLKDLLKQRIFGLCLRQFQNCRRQMNIQANWTKPKNKSW